MNLFIRQIWSLKISKIFNLILVIRRMIGWLFQKLKQVISSEDKKQIGREIGELLFGMANLARDWGLNAENLLRESNQRFIEGVTEAEKTFRKGGNTKE